MKFATIIPARGGSKGIPHKNIISLAGKPLIAYTIEAAFASDVISQVWVSTDSPEIGRTAEQFGARVIERPAALATDDSPTETTLIHAIEAIQLAEQKTPEHLLTLQPTSPLRRPETIRRFIDHYFSLDETYDALLSLTKEKSDFWIYDESHDFRRLFPNAPRRRQDRKPMFTENSSLYMTRTQSLLETHSILGHHCNGFLIEASEAIDINEPLDLAIAESLIK
ncbi:MAG: acylneuraminate cytidylyltransferase family protein [Cyanobacteria bacterium P01_G01_bin.54]